MKQHKPPNKNVSTTAILIAKHTDTGATLRCGAILYDSTNDKEFILLQHGHDYSKFIDTRRPDNGFIKIQIINKEDYGND
jgi:hypothetical protein